MAHDLLLLLGQDVVEDRLPEDERAHPQGVDGHGRRRRHRPSQLAERQVAVAGKVLGILRRRPGGRRLPPRRRRRRPRLLPAPLARSPLATPPSARLLVARGGGGGRVIRPREQRQMGLGLLLVLR